MLYVFNIVANQMNWQKTSFALAGNQTVILTASGTWGVIDPAHRGQCGPAGNVVTGTGDIIAPGAKEGALLCRTADGNVVAFPESCTVTLGTAETVHRHR